MKKILISSLIMISFQVCMSQNLDELDSYRVEEFYEKIDLDYGSLDEDGDDIDFIFIETEIELKSGIYEIEITDGPGDLYEIKGTNIFLSFNTYFGYAGYSQDCLLEITSAYYNSATVYKLD